MKAEKFGNAAEQLFAQFLYRITMLKRKYNAANFTLAFFCNPIFLSGTAYKKFREFFLNNFEYQSGVAFSAGHFDDTSSSWPISFSIWKCKI